MSWANGLVPWLRPYAIALYDRAGPGFTITSVRRSLRQQTDLYRRYLAGKHKYPVAPPGYSMHQYGYAFDMYNPDDDELARLGALWVSWGGCWNQRDNVHFGVHGTIGSRHVC